MSETVHPTSEIFAELSNGGAVNLLTLSNGSYGLIFTSPKGEETKLCLSAEAFETLSRNSRALIENQGNPVEHYKPGWRVVDPSDREWVSVKSEE